MDMRKRERFRIVSLDVDTGSREDLTNDIVDLAKKGESSYVCFANVHMTIEAHDNPSFATVVNGARYVLPDGMPLVKTLKWIHRVEQERMAGMDLFPSLMSAAEKNGIGVFLFGSTEDDLQRIVHKAQSEFPLLKIAGTCSPSFTTSLDDPKYIDQIQRSGAGMVFVALGCPKQELWMGRNTAKLNSVLLGVGGAFAVYAGTVSRAPEFMQRWSLEWLYRLMQEPRRLLKRYFVTNVKFLYLATKAGVTLNRKDQK